MAEFTSGSAAAAYMEPAGAFTGSRSELQGVKRQGMRKTRKANPSSRPGAARSMRRVPMIVPHGAAGAGRDFESAFDVLRCDRGVHELWKRKTRKQSRVRAH